MDKAWQVVKIYNFVIFWINSLIYKTGIVGLFYINQVILTKDAPSKQIIANVINYKFLRHRKQILQASTLSSMIEAVEDFL